MDVASFILLFSCHLLLPLDQPFCIAQHNRPKDHQNTSCKIGKSLVASMAKMWRKKSVLLLQSQWNTKMQERILIMPKLTANPSPASTVISSLWVKGLCIPFTFPLFIYLIIDFLNFCLNWSQSWEWLNPSRMWRPGPSQCRVSPLTLEWCSDS